MLEAAGRRRTAFCACELRSPALFTEDGFRSFNGAYAAVLKEWGILLLQAYTVHEIHRGLAEEIVARGAARHGLTWHDCRPPVQGLDYEMDCRGMPVERVLA
ncbi:hypothetical protein [Roseomonas sp. AR75]|uniref:hypothetical protein n=1 Tax=Roseomonas sp. AR75 TaxID=2562311 RepID=UPI00197F7558|nr:hypothetical protein [Roseomonas sp. AR75]